MPHTFEEKLREGMRSLELQAAFGAKKYWESQSKLAEWNRRLLGRHGQEYFSPLRPIFLQQLKAVEAISVFSPLMVRDGALSLARFFHRHPQPYSPKDLLLIPGRLAAFVPERWLNSAAYYTLRSRRALAPTAGLRIALILTAVDDRQCSLDFLRTSLRELHARYRTYRPVWETVSLVADQVPFAETYDARGRWLLDAGRIIDQELGPSVRSLTPAELLSGSRRETVYADFNPLSFYLHDSYVTQRLLALGATPAFAERDLDESSQVVPLSFSHEIVISEYPPEDVAVARAHVQSEWDRYRHSSLTKEEEDEFSEDDIALGGPLVPKSFVDLAFRLAQAYAR